MRVRSARPLTPAAGGSEIAKVRDCARSLPAVVSPFCIHNLGCICEGFPPLPPSRVQSSPFGRLGRIPGPLWLLRQVRRFRLLEIFLTRSLHRFKCGDTPCMLLALQGTSMHTPPSMGSRSLSGQPKPPFPCTGAHAPYGFRPFLCIADEYFTVYGRFSLSLPSSPPPFPLIFSCGSDPFLGGILV